VNPSLARLRERISKEAPVRLAHKVLQRMVKAVLVLTLGYPALAATPAQQLDEAAELFNQGQYEQAKRILLEINRDQLTDEQKQRRDELVGEVEPAINQSAKARQNLGGRAQGLRCRRPCRGRTAVQGRGGQPVCHADPETARP